MESVEESLWTPQESYNPQLNYKDNNSYRRLEVYNDTQIVAVILAYAEYSLTSSRNMPKGYIVHTKDLDNVNLKRSIYDEGCEYHMNIRFAVSDLKANFGPNLTTNIDDPNQ